MKKLTETEVLENLCMRDSRNPDHTDVYACYESDWGEIPAPRENCACDNCFYGRDRLALEILRLKEALRRVYF